MGFFEDSNRRYDYLLSIRDGQVSRVPSHHRQLDKLTRLANEDYSEAIWQLAKIDDLLTQYQKFWDRVWQLSELHCIPPRDVLDALHAAEGGQQ